MHSLPYQARQNYLFPLGRSFRPLTNDLSLNLAGLRHDELLREQAQIERLVRTNHHSLFADAYSREVTEKERRIAELLREEGVFERQKMKRTLVDEQLAYQKMLLQIQSNHYAVMGKRRFGAQSGYRGRTKIFENLDDGDLRKKMGEDSFKVEERARSLNRSKLKEGTESISQDSGIINAQIKQNNLLRQCERKGYHTYISQAAIEEKSVQKQQKQGQSDFKHIRTSSAEFQSHRTVASAKPKNNRVSFDLSANFVSTPKSPQHDNSSFLKPNSIRFSHQTQTPPASKDCKVNAQQKIRNRINLSQTIYRDSDLKNIKHEILHLKNTYETELKLRRGLRLRINNEPGVIEKHSIVVQRQ